MQKIPEISENSKKRINQKPRSNNAQWWNQQNRKAGLFRSNQSHAAILSFNQGHEQQASHLIAKAGKDSFGAYLIHIPVLSGAMISFNALGAKTIWTLGLRSTAIAIFLSFFASHKLRNSYRQENHLPLIMNEQN